MGLFSSPLKVRPSSTISDHANRRNNRHSLSHFIFHKERKQKPSDPPSSPLSTVSPSSSSLTDTLRDPEERDYFQAFGALSSHYGFAGAAPGLPQHMTKSQPSPERGHPSQIATPAISTKQNRRFSIAFLKR